MITHTLHYNTQRLERTNERTNEPDVAVAVVDDGDGGEREGKREKSGRTLQRVQGD